MDTIHVKTGHASETITFKIQPYGAPAKVPLWLIGLGVGAAAIAIIAAARWVAIGATPK